MNHLLTEIAELRRQGKELGQKNIVRRARELFLLSKHATSEEAVMELIGRFHVLYLTTAPHSKTRALADIGRTAEYNSIQSY